MFREKYVRLADICLVLYKGRWVRGESLGRVKERRGGWDADCAYKLNEGECICPQCSHSA